MIQSSCRCLFSSSSRCEKPSNDREYFIIFLLPYLYTASGVSSFPFLCWTLPWSSGSAVAGSLFLVTPSALTCLQKQREESYKTVYVNVGMQEYYFRGWYLEKQNFCTPQNAWFRLNRIVSAVAIHAALNLTLPGWNKQKKYNNYEITLFSNLILLISNM